MVQGNISDESSVEACIGSAKEQHGPIHNLTANACITDESHEYHLWEIPLQIWQKTYNTNLRGTFLTIKHFLRVLGSFGNLAIIVTGTETGKFGQAGHTGYASGKGGLQYGLVRGVKNDIGRLNSKAKINSVAPGWVDTPLIEGRLDDPKELWTEAQATVPLKKIAQPQDVARATAFLASHRAAGHSSGECINVDGGMEGRMVCWKESEIIEADPESTGAEQHSGQIQIYSSNGTNKVLATNATGKRPVGYRAPLYRIRESPYALLEAYGFLYGKPHLWASNTAKSTLTDDQILL
ncbi:MAG: hypothetical protein M1830_010669 [Pleopsidium flavum]|nr:MAG: hypothetical protein M1830_010669 [Pleopsidium flavum]